MRNALKHVKSLDFDNEFGLAFTHQKCKYQILFPSKAIRNYWLSVFAMDDINLNQSQPSVLPVSPHSSVIINPGSIEHTIKSFPPTLTERVNTPMASAPPTQPSLQQVNTPYPCSEHLTCNNNPSPRSLLNKRDPGESIYVYDSSTVAGRRSPTLTPPFGGYLQRSPQTSSPLMPQHYSASPHLSPRNYPNERCCTPSPVWLTSPQQSSHHTCTNSVYPGEQDSYYSEELGGFNDTDHEHRDNVHGQMLRLPSYNTAVATPNILRYPPIYDDTSSINE